jgi:glutaredoxin-related protein
MNLFHDRVCLLKVSNPKPIEAVMQVLNVLRTLQFVKLTDIMTKEEIDFLLNSYPDYSTFPWEKNPKTPSLYVKRLVYMMFIKHR